MKPDSEAHDLLVAFLLVQNALTRRSDLFFQGFGLTDAQFNILNLLANHEGPMDQLTLTDRLLVGKSSVSIVLNRMVRAELIQRQEHPRDRRRVVLALTRKGREIWRKIAPRYEEGVDEIFGTLPAKDRRRFVDSLEILYGALKRHAEVNSPPGPGPTLREMVRQLSTSPQL